MEKTPIFIPKKVSRVLCLLHGYGSNGEDMLSLGQALGETETAIICPNGFNEMGFRGYQWFPLENEDFETDKIIGELSAKAEGLVPKIQEIVEEFCHRVHVPMSRVVLGGFSQGGLVALAIACQTAGINQVIGMSAVPYDIKKEKIKNRPSILLTHGESDPVVPVQSALLAVQKMQKIGLSVEVCLSPCLGHGVDEICMDKIRQFIEKS